MLFSDFGSCFSGIIINYQLNIYTALSPSPRVPGCAPSLQAIPVSIRIASSILLTSHCEMYNKFRCYTNQHNHVTTKTNKNNPVLANQIP